MGIGVAIEKRTGDHVNVVSSSQVTIENDKNNKGLALLKQGQQITGIVVDTKEQVTLDFNGQKVTTSKSVLNDAKPGDVKTFEVVKATDNEIELKLLDGKNSNERKTFKATRMKDKDWDTILSQKEQVAKQAGRESEYKDIKNKLDEISSKMTQKDCKQLEDEGFSIETYTLSGLYAALNRIKGSSTGGDDSTSQKMTAYDKAAIANRLKEENLPVTNENLAKISEAMELGGAAKNMDDKAMKYLISREALPSIENIYKAYYSGAAKSQDNSTKLSQKAWKELENQVKEVISAAGYEVTDENMADAKWLIENNLPLTTETFTYKKNLEEIKTNSDKETIFNKIMNGMKSGTNPKDVSLLPPKDTSLEQVVADIKTISDDAVTQAVNEGSELTIKRLVTIQEGLRENTQETSKPETVTKDLSGNGNGTATVTSETTNVKKDITNRPNESIDTATALTDGKEASEAGADNSNNYIQSSADSRKQYEEARAKRQLEEIRLKMNLEAANQLEKKGISVETEELSKVVDALRELEDSYYKNLLKEADAQASELSLKTLQETTQSIEKLRYLPCSVLGSTLAVRNSQTITGLITEGSKLQAQYEKAGTAYETLATVPNREYGDSLQKAFTNADTLLSQMNLDNSEQNRRAVRILGYNQMDINQENINQVKAYDKQVTDLIHNLHPAVTVRMIKEGINPLEMPISELNSAIDRIKEEQGITSEDKYSTYLRQLEKEEGITEEERKAYIGVYRLLYNIDKSDGAAIGAVVKADREVTLGNLLTAVQTSKKGSLDAVINDEFGTLQSISHDKETIAGQLSTFFGKEGQSNSGGSDGNGQQSAEQEQASLGEQTEYLNRILKGIKDEITPEKLKEAGSKITHTVTSGSQAAGTAPLLYSDQGIWDTIKGVPVEKLWEQLRNMEDTQAAETDAYAGKVREIRELCKTSEQSIRFLNDYRIPSTPLNILLTNQVLSSGESAIKKLFNLKSKNSDENSENGLKETNELSDKLIDKHSMKEAYEELETDAKTVLLKACEGEKIDSRKLAELKSMGQQMTLTRTLAEKEFYQIPIETEKGITNMNLTILRGTQTSGKVSVNVWSEQLGNLKAEFTLKDQALKGFFSSDSQYGLKQLQNCTGEIEAAAKECNVAVKQIDFGIQRRENDAYSYQNTDNGTSDTTASGDTERILYRIAKSIVWTVRTAENNGSNE